MQFNACWKNMCKNVYKENSLRLFVEIIGLANKIEYINLNKQKTSTKCVHSCLV